MGLETVNTLGSPAVPQRTVQLHRQGLQLHPALESVRRSGAAPDNPVDLFLDIDERLFHWLKEYCLQRPGTSREAAKMGCVEASGARAPAAW